MSEEEILELHAIVSGHVQGVGFRGTVRDKAIHLGLKGTVCNLSDGDVEIYAQGSKKQLEQFLEQIQNRRVGSIKSLETKYYSPAQRYEHFAIVYNPHLK